MDPHRSRWLARTTVGLGFVFVTGLIVIQCGQVAMPQLVEDGGRHDIKPGASPLNANCTADGDCQSEICEFFADGSKTGRCVAKACEECYGLDPTGTTCIPVPDKLPSATCDGTCSTNYTGPTGVRVCCAHQCWCTDNSICPSP
jgi:hypothetical protein